MKSCLMLNCLKFHHIIHDTTRDRVYAPASTLLAKNNILGSRLIACCKLAQTLARQIWRHNYVIGRNEYLISTLSEPTFPWVHWLQFLFKSTHHSWRCDRKCEWMFSSEHSVLMTNRKLHAFSIGSKVDDLGWPWTAIISNFLGISCDLAILAGNNG